MYKCKATENKHQGSQSRPLTILKKVDVEHCITGSRVSIKRNKTIYILNAKSVLNYSKLDLEAVFIKFRTQTQRSENKPAINNLRTDLLCFRGLLGILFLFH